ncbi:MAG: SPOR domain-containing protein [Bacteroidales bacterium]
MNIRKSHIVILLLILSIKAFSQTDCYVDIIMPSKLQAGEEYSINIIIYKENISGFAKLELYLPVGIELFPVESSEATLIIQNQIAKYIWIELPSSKEIKLTAKIKVNHKISGYKEIYGNFYFIQDRNKSKISVGIIPFQVLNDFKWKNYENQKQQSEYPKTVEVNKVKPLILNQPHFYRVQIAAFKKKLSKNQLSEIYPAIEYVKEEFIDGLYKYTIGDFKSFEDAKDFKNQSGIFGAFVVRYENFKRITTNTEN